MKFSGCSYCEREGKEWRFHSLKNSHGKVICPVFIAMFDRMRIMERCFSSNTYTFICKR